MLEQEKHSTIEKTKKTHFTFKETQEYLGVSKSTLYKYNMYNVIPYSKPNGRKVYYKIEDLNNYLLRNPIRSEEQLDKTAELYFQNCPKGQAI
ncbi:MAG: helix-turn-helix domain-containing protein [Candidatus Delongbacteria bacterium]|nr:helix-turn-helix domain-containing protein [Candidatus Delongbacteria bacterium]